MARMIISLKQVKNILKNMFNIINYKGKSRSVHLDHSCKMKNCYTLQRLLKINNSSCYST